MNSEFRLSRDDLLIVNNALNEVLHGPDAIDEAEFQIRIGQERVKAPDLLAASAKSWILGRLGASTVSGSLALPMEAVALAGLLLVVQGSSRAKILAAAGLA